MIENTFACNPENLHVIAGDFNFEILPGSIGYSLFAGIAADYNLVCCDSLHSNLKYTYCHATLNQQSWLDHFFVSHPLFNSVISCDAVDRGDNLSDHVPVYCVIKVDFAACDRIVTNKISQPLVYRERWDLADTVKFYLQSGVNLQSIEKPSALLDCDDRCACEEHRVEINRFYERIVNALKISAVGCVPRIAVNSLKPFWNENLDKLKQISIDMHTLWRSCGSPRSGIINTARLKAKYDFKTAIKNAEHDYERNHCDELDFLFKENNSKKFWKRWSAKFSKKSVYLDTIEGISDPQSVADKFAEYYGAIYTDSSIDSKAVDDFHTACRKFSPKSDGKHLNVDIETIEKCISSLKSCKAAGHDGISPEHLIHSHPCLISLLKMLFMLMFKHEYVPEAFGRGLIIPIAKDRNGDLHSLENYRPITLSPVISKVFELLLGDLLKIYFCTDPLQFGFKDKLGCRNALFALRCVLQYFNQRGSNVYMASLDATKAFD